LTVRAVGFMLLLSVAGAVGPALADNDTGQKIFKDRCVVCHQEDGHGAAGVAPSLAGTLARHLGSAEGKHYLAQILISGMVGSIDTEGHKFSGLMPSFRADLSDTDIAATINYVLGTFNGVSDATATSPITPQDVSTAAATNPAPSETRALRQSLQKLYTLNCSGCHGADGVGVPEAGIPNLNEAGRYVQTELGREYLIEVPGLSQSRLDDATAARLLNWVLQRFSGDRLPADFKPYTAAEVSRFRSEKVSDPKTRRDAILAELRN
jgi:mono/diheme cytochrome c family protein